MLQVKSTSECDSATWKSNAKMVGRTHVQESGAGRLYRSPGLQEPRCLQITERSSRTSVRMEQAGTSLARYWCGPPLGVVIDWETVVVLGIHSSTLWRQRFNCPGKGVVALRPPRQIVEAVSGRGILGCRCGFGLSRIERLCLRAVSVRLPMWMTTGPSTYESFRKPSSATWPPSGPPQRGRSLDAAHPMRGANHPRQPLTGSDGRCNGHSEREPRDLTVAAVQNVRAAGSGPPAKGG